MTEWIKYYGYILCEFVEKYNINYLIKDVATGETVKQLSYESLLYYVTKTCEKGWMPLAVLGLCALIGYLFGSLNFAVIISKLFYHDDVRSHGSGNAGATNMVRIYGIWAGIATFALDGVKCAVSVYLSMFLMGEGGAFIGGLFCIIGHIFPVFYKFRGGKGVVVSAIIMLVLNPLAFLILLLIFVCIVAASKYISLGSVICAFFYPLLLNAMSQGKGGLGTIAATVSVLIAVIVIVMHRSNIKRLMNRTESKFSFKKKENK